MFDEFTFFVDVTARTDDTEPINTATCYIPDLHWCSQTGSPAHRPPVVLPLPVIPNPIDTSFSFTSRPPGPVQYRCISRFVVLLRNFTCILSLVRIFTLCCDVLVPPARWVILLLLSCCFFVLPPCDKDLVLPACLALHVSVSLTRMFSVPRKYRLKHVAC